MSDRSKKQKINQEKIIKVEKESINLINEYEKNNEKIEMSEILNKIEEELKLVVVLYYYNDLPIKDIAKILKIPKGTVQSRLQRAREKLYNILTKREVYNNEQTQNG